jgi:NAD(P)H-hydrate epimerase
MNELPINLYVAQQTRKLDELVVNEYGISANILIERAGDAAFDVLRRQWPDAKRIAVCCGIGNNGADGFVIARLAHEQGMQVDVYQVGDKSRLRDDALSALQRMQGVDLNPIKYADQSLEGFDVIVDAMLGTGLSGALRDPFLKAINAINQATEVPVMAVDVPSGLNADTGVSCGAAITADVTITFIGLKQGMVTAEGRDYCGEIIFNDLKLPLALYDSVAPSSMRLEYQQLKSILKKRKQATHKADFGHVLLVGGNIGMPGAIRLAGEAALRTGAGLVTIATRESHAASISSARPELIVRGVEDNETLKELSASADVIAIGPGLGKDQWARQMLAIAVARHLPVVVDADALNLLSNIDIQRNQWILTPHPGEAAKLIGCETSVIQTDRFSAINKISALYKAIVVLKGSGTLVKTGGKATGICTAGNSGLATAGTGDVLTGVIASLVAQGHTLSDAAELGVCLHAEAGDMAIRGIGERGLIASDLMVPLRRLVNPDSQRAKQ